MKLRTGPARPEPAAAPPSDPSGSMIAISWLVLHWGRGACGRLGLTSGGAAGRAGRPRQPILKFVDPCGDHRPAVLACDSLVFAILRQRILRALQIRIVKDTEVQACDRIIRLEFDRLQISLFGAAVIAAFAIQDAEPAPGEIVLRTDRYGAGEAADGLVALLALRLQCAQI